jgi:hypothetical protein
MPQYEANAGAREGREPGEEEERLGPHRTNLRSVCGFAAVEVARVRDPGCTVVQRDWLLDVGAGVDERK